MANYSIPTDRDITRKAYDLILADLSVYDSIAVLAAKVGTNSFTLKTVFKKYYGISVFAFSRYHRIEKAKELLLQTNYTLQTIGELVGYSEGPNFQTAFRTVVGCPAGEWRKHGGCPANKGLT